MLPMPGELHPVRSEAHQNNEESVAEARFARGATIAGRYEVVRFLGRGPHGEVYDVHDVECGVRVALKVIHADFAADDWSARCIAWSVVLARDLNSRHVCRTYDLGRHRSNDDDALFFTMALLKGESLAARIRRHGPRSPAASLPILRQVAAALAAGHHEGAVHQKQKLEHGLLAPDDETDLVVLTDLGLPAFAAAN